MLCGRCKVATDLSSAYARDPGRMSPHELRVLADAARHFGNGHIDLTRRANLQLRGVSEGSLPSLHDAIARLGLLDDSPDGEAVRNVMINPLAGMDPAEVLDARGVGRELERRLATEKSIWALPSKFGFIVDGGGVLSLAEQRADVRLVAIAHGSEAAFAVGLETRSGTEWLGSISPDAAAAAAIEIGLAFINVASREPRQRMRDLSDEGLWSIRSAMRSRLDRLPENLRQGRFVAESSRWFDGARRQSVCCGNRSTVWAARNRSASQAR